MANTEVSQPEYLTVDEAADFMRTPKATLYQWRMKAYGPPALRVGVRLLYKRADIVAWLDEQTA